MIVSGERFIVASEREHDIAAAKPSQGETWSDDEGFINRRQCFAGAMQIREQLRPPQMRFGPIGPAGNGSIKARNGIDPMFHCGKRHAAIEPVFDRSGCQGHGAIIALDCLGVAAEIAEQVAAVAVRLREVGRERNCPIEARQCLFALTERAQRTTEQKMGAGVARSLPSARRACSAPSSKRPCWQESAAR